MKKVIFELEAMDIFKHNEFDVSYNDPNAETRFLFAIDEFISKI